MASLGKDPSQLSLPALKADQLSEAGESIYKSERPSSIPVPTARVGSGPVFTKLAPPPSPQPKSTSPTPQYRPLSPTEWARVAHGVGAIKEGETHTVVHPTCWYWPPKGLPDGLYRDVIAQRSKFFIGFYALSTIQWCLMVLQIVLGATLTALGSVQSREGIPITVLAAVTTIDAGLLALIHNSGLPDRYRRDKVEFNKVEDFLKELLDTGIVESHRTVDDILSICFDRFQTAKATVMANMPESYTAVSPLVREKSSMTRPDQPVQFYSSQS